MPGRSERWGFGGHFGAPMSGDGIDRREQRPLRLDHLGGVQAQVLAVARGDDLHAQRQAAGDAGRDGDRGKAEQVHGNEQALRARHFGVMSRSGYRASCASGTQVGIGEIGPRPYGSGLAAMAIE